jgi:hypothetical protein
MLLHTNYYILYLSYQRNIGLEKLHIPVGLAHLHRRPITEPTSNRNVGFLVRCRVAFWEVQYSALVLVFKSGQTETVFTLLAKLGALTISKETSLES